MRRNRSASSRALDLRRRAARSPRRGLLLRTIAGESVIVVRGRDGAVRAFYNVCAPRDAAVRGATRPVLRNDPVPYHAWTYTSTGS